MKDALAIYGLHDAGLDNLFSRLETEQAFLPHYPEMLDFDLVENHAAERHEIEVYLAAFNPEQR
jgi:hypothetical protein